LQVGGVYTPAVLRSRGYARSPIAASLALARQNGATRSVLFTAEDVRVRAVSARAPLDQGDPPDHAGRWRGVTG